LSQPASLARIDRNRAGQGHRRGNEESCLAQGPAAAQAGRPPVTRTNGKLFARAARRKSAGYVIRSQRRGTSLPKRSCGCAMRSLAALRMTRNSRRKSAGYVIRSQRRGISPRLAQAFVWLCNEIPRCAQDDMELSAESADLHPSLGRKFVGAGETSGKRDQ